MKIPRFEVEQKFRVDSTDQLTASLRELNPTPFTVMEQVDTYFAHPARDFAQTDEAFRLRQVGEQNFVTYKGPKIDLTTKTREELELPLPQGAEYVRRFAELLEALGFQRVAQVHKVRRMTTVIWRGREVELALDDVADVGSFVELELTVDAEEVTRAKDCVASLAGRLGLTNNERRSYLELASHAADRNRSVS